MLENVLGIAAVLDDVKARITKELPEYELYITVISP